MIRAIVLACLLVLAGCDDKKPVPEKNVQAAKAAAVANTISFAENAEIEGIERRLKLTSNPGLSGYVILLNEMGQAVMYTGVTGKVTSGSKRLTKTWEKATFDCGAHSCTKEVPAPSDEGTYGSSGEYVYFWTAAGQYIQWNGKYLYSDKPFRLAVEPLVSTVTLSKEK